MKQFGLNERDKLSHQIARAQISLNVTHTDKPSFAQAYPQNIDVNAKS